MNYAVNVRKIMPHENNSIQAKELNRIRIIKGLFYKNRQNKLESSHKTAYFILHINLWETCDDKNKNPQRMGFFQLTSRASQILLGSKTALFSTLSTFFR